MFEQESYKFKGGQGMVERGSTAYGSKKSNKCACPVCEGGSKLMLFQCKNCKGTGQVENAKPKVCPDCGGKMDIHGECESCGYDMSVNKNSDGTEILKKQEELQDCGPSPVKEKKRTGPFAEV